MTFEHLGYTVERGPDGNYRVRPPAPAGWWAEKAATLETAKRWIRHDLAERRAAAARRARR